MEETLIKRVMPNSLEAEQSVIGSMIMDQDAIVTAMEILLQEDFYHKQYGILFDAMIYKLPIVLFVPDLEEYVDNRGFYLDYREIPGIRARNERELIEIFTDPSVLDASVNEAYMAFYRKYMAACDGHATERIIRYIKRYM